MKQDSISDSIAITSSKAANDIKFDFAVFRIKDMDFVFYILCYRKLLEDGYFDFEPYIKDRPSLKELEKMLPEDSLYRKLFEGGNASNEYGGKKKPDESIYDYWSKRVDNDAYTKGMSYTESEALLYRVFGLIDPNDTERDKELCRRYAYTMCFADVIDEENHINHHRLPLDENFHPVVARDNGRGTRNKESYIFFDGNRLEPHFIYKLSDLYTAIRELHSPINVRTFYRGQSRVNYRVLPGLFRESRKKKYYPGSHPREDKGRDELKDISYYESEMYHSIQAKCPEEFVTCHNPFEKLVKMQHYGLPTRLLDVSESPLVALYFACSGDEDSYGELQIFRGNCGAIKNPDSLEVQLPAVLAELDNSEKEELIKLYSSFAFGRDNPSSSFRVPEELKQYKAIYNRIRALVPVLPDVDSYSINKFFRTISSNVYVEALRTNQRIRNQQGAFVIAGLQGEEPSGIPLNRASKFKPDLGKTLTGIYFIANKTDLKKELSQNGIDKTFIYPEIESVSSYLKAFYNDDPYARKKPGDLIEPVYSVDNANHKKGRKFGG